VTPESPASKSGLINEDLILTINEQVASYENLFKTFARSKPGDSVLLGILRNKENIDIEIISGELN
jgi:S1-C subfamily serine protease